MARHARISERMPREGPQINDSRANQRQHGHRALAHRRRSMARRAMSRSSCRCMTPSSRTAHHQSKPVQYMGMHSTFVSASSRPRALTMKLLPEWGTLLGNNFLIDGVRQRNAPPPETGDDALRCRRTQMSTHENCQAATRSSARSRRAISVRTVGMSSRP
jgi:hypothetical protein